MRSAERLAGKSPIVDQALMRRVCGNYATGVAIVSTRRADSGYCGVTINSFSSVSLDPPLILWSLRSTSPSLVHFESGGPFAVSILAEDQHAIASRFAKALPNKFEGVEHHPGALGAPVIKGSVAHLECLPYKYVEAGDHVVFIWHVAAAHQSLIRTPLAFYEGQFHRVTPLIDRCVA